MRTTVTLEPDVHKQLLEIEHEQQESFKKVLNAVLRAGLATYAAESKECPRSAKKRKMPSFTKTAALGKSKVGSFDDISAALALSEGEHFK